MLATRTGGHTQVQLAIASSFREIKLRLESCTITERILTLVTAVFVFAIAVTSNKKVIVVIIQLITFWCTRSCRGCSLSMSTVLCRSGEKGTLYEGQQMALGIKERPTNIYSSPRYHTPILRRRWQATKKLEWPRKTLYSSRGGTLVDDSFRR